jgi:hypothetical protein
MNATHGIRDLSSDGSKQTLIHNIHGGEITLSRRIAVFKEKSY